jgi:hypothetical protein
MRRTAGETGTVDMPSITQRPWGWGINNMPP